MASAGWRGGGQKLLPPEAIRDALHGALEVLGHDGAALAPAAHARRHL